MFLQPSALWYRHCDISWINLGMQQKSLKFRWLEIDWSDTDGIYKNLHTTAFSGEYRGGRIEGI